MAGDATLHSPSPQYAGITRGKMLLPVVQLIAACRLRYFLGITLFMCLFHVLLGHHLHRFLDILLHAAKLRRLAAIAKLCVNTLTPVEVGKPNEGVDLFVTPLDQIPIGDGLSVLWTDVVVVHFDGTPCSDVPPDPF